MENCLFCETKLKSLGNVNSYFEGADYQILECPYCYVQCAFGDLSRLDRIYDSIYLNSRFLGGYHRYEKYFDEIKKLKGLNAIRYLSNLEETYKFIYKVLNDLDRFKTLNILEVGCGLGYFTYALKEAGFNIIGVDVSEIAIVRSKEAFGDFFYTTDTHDNQKKYDLIIATEVIEHVKNPLEFVSKLKNNLTLNGKIILSTPRKFTQQSKSLWLTELPPIHLFWFTSVSLKKLGEKIGMKFIEFEFSHKNTLHFDSKTNSSASLDSNLNPIKNTHRKNRIKSLILFYSPNFLKKFYYVSLKKQKVFYSNEHSTIFFAYENRSNESRLS